ncbi:MAG TPA: imidazole glycerol phosphate synthase subunit HisF [Gemmatimonadaceae bacterium]
MLSRRLIVCLDVQGARVVKGTRFQSLRDVGDPVELAERYEAAGADEIVFLDISASADERATLLEMVNRTAARLFIPLTVGGGIRSVADVSRALRAGADKVSMNSAAVARPELITECAERYGAQCVVASIDAKREGDGWLVRTRGGRSGTALDAVEWARECAARGAGEILLTSIDRDGVRGGYDLELTRSVSRTVNVPVVASGGAGTAEHVVDAFRVGEADAALVAGILHDRITTVAELKEAMQGAGIPTRIAATREANMDPRFRGDDGEGSPVIPAKAGIHVSRARGRS